MAYYTDLYSPETYEAFGKSDRSTTGFRIHQKIMAGQIHPGDRFICYLTKLGRWIGILEVMSDCYEDSSPIFMDEDPFTVRFQVKPLVWLDKEKALPIRDDRIWNFLSFTQGRDKKSSSWTGHLRGSMKQLLEADGKFLETELLTQAEEGLVFPINDREMDKLKIHKIRSPKGEIAVSVPQNGEEEGDDLPPSHPSARESIQIQALLGDIGAKMGMRIWIPRNDKAAVLAEWKSDNHPVLDILPLNYDEITLKTIEQIDVLWLRGRAIIRAFEVEHTTSIYSGILRMADLLALQPNMDIKLHIVAPSSRREKVFQELRRPVFSLLERGPLSENCSYLSYESIREIANQRLLVHMSDSVLDAFAETAE